MPTPRPMPTLFSAAGSANAGDARTEIVTIERSFIRIQVLRVSLPSRRDGEADKGNSHAGSQDAHFDRASIGYASGRAHPHSTPEMSTVCRGASAGNVAIA